MTDESNAGGAPTFSRDISRLFTQYDQIQMSYAFDLRSYEDVKKHAQAIYLVVQPDPNNPGQSKYPGIPVMPLYEAPWTQEMVDTFKAWMDAGYPPGELPPPPPKPTEVLPIFLMLSAYLTGIGRVLKMPELGQIYLDRLAEQSEHAGEMDRLLALGEELGHVPAEERPRFMEEVVSRHLAEDAGLAGLAQDVVLVWYNTTVQGNLGTPQNNQYTDALVWPVADTHPMGWATEITPFYWRYQPENGQYTGLRPPAPSESQQGHPHSHSSSGDAGEEE